MGTEPSDDADDGDPMREMFDKYRPLDVAVTSNAADGATIDLNGTQLFLKQAQHTPMLVELYIEDEEQPIGAINIARGETVTLGGVDERLTNRVEGLRDELEDVDEALAELETRLNPTNAGESYGPGQHDPEETPHVAYGVGEDTYVCCAEDGECYGPAADDGAMPFCPYCGAPSDSEGHDAVPHLSEVFCDETMQSTYRFCPGCGEEL